MPKVAGDGGGGRRSEDLRVVFLRVGAAVTLSLAGLLLSRRRPRQLRLPPPPTGSDDRHGMKSGGGLKDELRILKNEDTKAKIINGNSVHTTTTTTTTTTTALVPLPPKCRTFADDEGFLLPEFNEMVLKEFGQDFGDNTTSPAARVMEEVASKERQICELQDMVRSLQEREKTLELQLLECYGLQEQDAAVRELENQLRINSVESKLYTLKIESLLSENERLQAQLAESSKLVSELEATRMKCKLLKKKLRQDAEQAKERITSLQQMVDSLQCKEITEGEVSAEVQKKLNRLEELENEARELRVVNSRLQQENAHLTRRLELIRLPPVPKPINSMEVKALQEVDLLRQENDKLAKEAEQLRSDRFADVEELVYLKWINACLRFELRNQQAPSGKNVARDLSKTLSPKSEHKAKQLILDYANAGVDEKNLDHIEFGSEYSSSRASSGEPDDASIDGSSMNKHRNPKKKRFFSKLRKLVLGKEKENKNAPTLERRISISSCSFDDFNGRESNDSYSSFMTESGVSANQQHDDHSRRWHSLDSQSLVHLTKEIADGRNIHLGVKSASFGEGRVTDFGHSSHLDNGEATIPEDAEIHKFAEALKTSRPGSRSSTRASSFRN
ncbi:protein CHUP1, chloroplastic [Oryza brachyantha]|uniref:Protein CHUP1, chloroplastic n=1 Tax=Oryza brachyantha TaxID=4533 RepID=J3M4L2_ORYBR|nr:protein CHUP1, chloroplastic [Oryza brachyantha]XP_015693384.1 protein CHUP1, chloroplastic [Oryza brachyantha]